TRGPRRTASRTCERSFRHRSNPASWCSEHTITAVKAVDVAGSRDRALGERGVDQVLVAVPALDEASREQDLLEIVEGPAPDDRIARPRRLATIALDSAGPEDGSAAGKRRDHP